MSLRNAAIRLAYRKKGLRQHLLPLLAKIVVPPRRGDIGRKIFLHRFFRTLNSSKTSLQGYASELEKVDQWDLKEFLEALGISDMWLLQAPENLEKTIDDLDWRAEGFLKSSEDDPEYFSQWASISKKIREQLKAPFSDWTEKKDKTSEAVETLEQAMASPRRIQEALEDSGMEWEPEYEEGLPPAAIEALKGFSQTTAKIKSELAAAKERLLALQGAEKEISGEPVGMEKLEKLYHASVNARKLFQQGFEKAVPEQEGLGGSQSVGGGGKGTSFTYDLYVAKEISRTLKELTMIARGEVGAKEVLDWAMRARVLDKVWADFSDYEGSLIRPYTGEVSGKRIRFRDSKGHPADVRQVFDTPVKVAALYKRFLQNMRHQRYDPYIMHIGKVVKKLSTVNPKDIGVVVATVNMAHPGVTHLGSEREIRVPPEAIVSVDKFF